MNSPFGSSNQGGFRQQPQQQNFGQQGGFGVQTVGTFGGFQPQQQSFGFGGGQGFGGFQPQQNFGGFGGGQGFGGFNPFQGGFGGFQPQQQFNSFQGGYGGGFQPQGFGGGFNPMFGGIGGLGFNPMMGPQFGMPMQGFNPYQQQFQPQFNQRQNVDSQGRVFVPDAPLPEGMVGTMGGTGYDPVTGRVDLGRAGGSGTYVQPQSPFTGPQRSAQDILSMAVGKTPKDMQYDLNKDGKITSADALAYHRQYGQQPAQQPQSPSQSLDTLQNTVVQAQQQNPAYAQLQELRKQFGGNQAPTQEQLQQLHGSQRQIENDPAVRDAQNRYETNARQQQTEDIRRRMQGELPRPMYGGIGGLGFNPMMGPQFGMPMKQVQRSQYENPQQRQVAEAEKARWASLTTEQRSDENNALRAQSQQEYSPIMGLQFGMPMGQQAQLPQQQAQLMQALQAAQMRAVMGI